MNAFFMLIIIFAYINIGYWWGCLSWKIWERAQHTALIKDRRSIAGLLSFPVSHEKDKLGYGRNDADWSRPPIANFSNIDYYRIAMMCAWPFKAVFNLFALVFFVIRWLFRSIWNWKGLLRKNNYQEPLPTAKALRLKQP